MISFIIWITQLRWLICCLFLFLISCKQEEKLQQLKFTAEDSLKVSLKHERAFSTIEKYKALIKPGDLILRTGNDFTSESLRKLSFSDKTFSHCGIASIENDSIFVYHALGGEWNPEEKLRRDPLALFCNPIENRGFGIFKFDLTSSQKNILDSIIKTWYRQPVMFDMNFDLTSDDRMYCAEFVSKAINIASNNSITFSSSVINNFNYIAIDNLFINPACVEVSRIKYQ